jgi:alpha-galactosidase
MKTHLHLLLLVFAGLLACTSNMKETQSKSPVAFDSLAISPPMGWNSWDCLGLDANEEQVKAVADYMSEHLKAYGWQYIVIDAGWYHPKELTTAKSQTKNPVQNMDAYGRLIPDSLKYPSSAGHTGFKSLAEYIHSKGLKFGIHVMRGIPWNAVSGNTPVKGTGYFASEIANLADTCAWSNIMKGVNMEKPGAQEYYNSVYELYAEWGVDFVKVDDISNPYHQAEIETVHKAILNAGAPIVLSLSPGPAPTAQWTHLAQNAHMWRISGDFWDDWKWLKRQFGICSQWDSVHTPGHWPDADMLPIGKLRLTGGDDWIASQLGRTIDEVKNEYSRFSDTEKYTLMTLWCIFRSPLMLGGYLPETDPVTYQIITNEEVIAVNQESANNHEVRNADGIVVRTADLPGSQSKYVAVFNINDGKPAQVSVSWEEMGMRGALKVRDLWAKKDLGTYSGEFQSTIEAHGCRLLKIGK